MDEGNPSATKTTLIVAQECSTALLGNAFVLYRRPRVQHGSLGQHFRTSSSPEGAGQNDVWMKETLRRRKPHLSSPKSAARHAWATLSHFFVARGCSAARLGNTFVHLRRPRVQHGTLGQHFRTSSSPKSAARHAWATPPRVSAARRYWAKDVRLNLTKKRRSLPKTRETSVGCPKPGSNRHVFKGHWILSPTRLPIPPFGHIHVDFPLDGNFALPLHFRFKGLQSY